MTAPLAAPLLVAAAVRLVYVGFLLVAHDFNPDFLAIDSFVDGGGR